MENHESSCVEITFQVQSFRTIFVLAYILSFGATQAAFRQSQRETRYLRWHRHYEGHHL